MNIYLDIDGVLLTKHGQPAEHLADFLDRATNTHDCYWLTTHCKGDVETAASYLKSKIDPILWAFVDKIKPTNWNTYKTEAIDFSSNFLWFDDYVFEKEKQDLETNKCTDKLITINLKTGPTLLSSLRLL